VGRTVADAFLAMYTLQSACEVQILAQSGGAQLVPVDPSVLAGARENSRSVTKGLGGALAWPGLLRRLDRIDSSYRS
jgi:ribulose-5-phosphate 4-epimerase/fuculose-1-phosphate aldolase